VHAHYTTKKERNREKQNKEHEMVPDLIGISINGGGQANLGHELGQCHCHRRKKKKKQAGSWYGVTGLELFNG
jgi:hypothetical protein